MAGRTTTVMRVPKELAPIFKEIVLDFKKDEVKARKQLAKAFSQQYLRRGQKGESNEQC